MSAIDVILGDPGRILRGALTLTSAKALRTFSDRRSSEDSFQLTMMGEAFIGIGREEREECRWDGLLERGF